MTFDDGILTVYSVQNTAENGAKPKYEPVQKEQFYFGFDVLGFSRFYTAKEAHTQLSHVVNIPGWPDLDTNDIVTLESDFYYSLAQIQPMWDDDGLKFTKLSLERITNEYSFNT